MTKHINKLTAAEAERLALLAKEMGDVIQLVGNIFLNGYEHESCAESDSTNRDFLEHHLGNVEHVIERLCNSKDIDADDLHAQSERYARTIGTFLNHQGDAL
jgi:hypothetical protein